MIKEINKEVNKGEKEEKEVKRNAVQMLTGEEPEEKIDIDLDKTPEEILNPEEDVDVEVKEENEILREIFNKDKLDMTTDLNRKGAVTMARAEMLGEIFDCEPLIKFANSIKSHLISNKRQGRKEIIEALKSTMNDGMLEPEPTDRPYPKIWESK